MNIRVLIADDHKIMREGLRSLLKDQPDIKVIAEAEDGRNAVQLACELLPDVVIMDVAMSDMNGIDATRKIIAGAPSVKVIALSMYSNRRFVIEMLKAGARGYLLKDCTFQDLASAIRTVFGNRTYLSPGISDILIKDYLHNLSREESDEKPTVFSILTEREREVIQLLAEGKTTKEIATVLKVSVKTIEAFRHKIMKKLNIHSIAKLTKYAVREGLTSTDN